MIGETLLRLNIAPRRFLLTTALPGAGAAALLSVLFLATAGREWTVGLRIGVVVALWLTIGLVVMGWPRFQMDRRRRQIDDALPMFITHFGVLSTSNLPRTQVIRKLADKKEYQALSQELDRLYDLVTNWNVSLPDAARRVGERTPSQLFSDLLDRLAYALETGQDMEAFLSAEQSVVLREYTAVYDNSIYRIEDWKDLYMSAVMSGAFFAIFAAIMPLLIGGDPAQLLTGVLVLLVFLELILMSVLQSRLPVDRLLHKLNIQTRERRRHDISLQIAFPATVAVGFLLYWLGVGGAWVVVGASIPLAVAGIVSQVEEARIKRREENYPAFIRSLGSAVEARGGGVKDILAHVRRHNFGPLSVIVNRLHARLHWRIDDDKAWAHFAAESGSDAVDNFTSMFVEGTRSGGKPAAIGEMISRNMTGIIGLRSGRYAAASSFRSLVISLTGAMAFIMFVGVGVLDSMANMFATAVGDQADLVSLGLNFSFERGGVRTVVVGILVAHGLLASVLIKLMDGGRFTGAWMHFAIMMTLCAFIGLGADALMPHVFSFGQ